MDAISALRGIAENRTSRWSFGDVARDADRDLAINRIRSGYFVPDLKPKFSISSGATFFALGSCFAREIETALLRKGVSVSSRLKEIETHPDFRVRPGVTTIHDFFNRYNVPSISREIRSLSASSPFRLGTELIYEQGEGRFDDLHYTAAVESAPLDLVLARREWVQARMRIAYQASDAVVITLGLSEAWYDVSAESYLNVVSSPQMLKRYREHLDVRMISYPEAASHLRDCLGLMLSDGKKVILTVSPVPLQTTFLGEDIVTANSAAKAILRALCQEAAFSFENVDYFPSFEMVANSDPALAWKPDGRHVQMKMVETIMSTALDAYLR